MKETAQSLCRLMFRVEVWCLGTVVYKLLDLGFRTVRILGFRLILRFWIRDV